MRKRFLEYAAAIWMGVFMALAGVAASAEAAAVGDPLPSVVLPEIESGQSQDVRDLVAGRPAALIYMQTSCAACRKELLAFKALKSKYPQLVVVVISVDAGTPARVKRYKEHFKFDFEFLHDPEFQTPEVFGFSFTPALVLVDKAGNIALLKGGYRPGDEKAIETKIQTLLSK